MGTDNGLNIVIINGDKYINNLLRRINLKGVKEGNVSLLNKEIADCMVSFYIYEEKEKSKIRIKTDQGESNFEVKQDLVEEFIFGIISIVCPLYIGLDFYDISSLILSDKANGNGDFYLKTMDEPIDVLYSKAIYIMIDGKEDVGLFEVSDFITKIDEKLNHSAELLYSLILNKTTEKVKETKVYMYVKY